METFAVTLEQAEALYLDDALNLRDAHTEEDLRLRYHLLTKIGIALLDTQQGQSCTVELTEPELWTVREYAKSSVRVGAQMVGMTLKMKCIAGLRAFDQAASVEYVSGIADRLHPKSPRRRIGVRPYTKRRLRYGPTAKKG